MPRTTDNLRIKDIIELRAADGARRSRDLIASRDRAKARRFSGPASSTAIIHPFRRAASDEDSHLEPASRLCVWWQRWLERRRFARELPWMADEVLEDYGLTREQARRLCRRPFWRA